MLLGFVLQGCAMMKSSPYGPDHATYSDEKLHVTYNNTLFRTYEASRSALQDMGMNITNVQKKPNEVRIDATMKNGTDVHLILHAEKPDLTAVDIKVGQYGLEPASREISEKIESHLKV